jgi:uncharacterized protein
VATGSVLAKRRYARPDGLTVQAMDLLQILSGFLVGLLVGITGVGGGSLLTPLLVLVFGVAPTAAVGTDLMFAAITKASGAWVHTRAGRVDWPLVTQLAYGSVPAALLTVAMLKVLAVNGKDLTPLVTPVLGVALLLTAVGLLLKNHILAYRARFRRPDFCADREPKVGTVIGLGAVLGVLVTLSSVGAGALGVTMLLILRPYLPIHRIVGSDIAHAVPLTLVAGLGYWMLGAVDWTLLATLLVGSIPGIWLGSHFGHRLPERALRVGLASILTVVGVKFVT